MLQRQKQEKRTLPSSGTPLTLYNGKRKWLLFRISIGGHTAILHDWEPLYPDAQRVKRVGAVGTALQLVLFGLRKFFTALIFLAILDTGRGDGDEQIWIVVPVDEHQVAGTAWNMRLIRSFFKMWFIGLPIYLDFTFHPLRRSPVMIMR